MTNEQVQEALIGWLNGLTGLTTIKAFQSAERPPKPYLMVEIGPTDELSEHAEQFRFDELDSQNLAGLNELKVTPLLEIEWTMLVYSYGEDGGDALRKVKSAYHLPQIQESLTPDSEESPSPRLMIHETGVINSIPELINEDWEPRSQLNIMLRGVTSDGFVIDTIEQHTPFDVEII